MDIVKRERWHDDYEAARKEYAAAEVQYKIADDALAVATTRRNSAERKLSQLFHERMNQVNA